MAFSLAGYSITSPASAQGSLFAGDEWRSAVERSLRPPRRVSRAAAIGIGFVLGTGAVTPAFSAPNTGSAPALVVSVRQSRTPVKFEAVSPAEQVIAIRSLLGLNILELATILHVQRPTIYSWQAGTATPHYENGSRLRYIYELAQQWSRKCTEPIGGWVRRPLDEGGSTLAALLSAEVVDETAVNHAFAELKARLEEDAKSFIGVRERIRRLGYKDRSRSKQDSSLDHETLL